MKKENPKKTIPIFFATDDHYAMFLQVALTSIIANASKDYLYRVIVLHTDLSEKYLDSIKTLENEWFSIDFFNVREELKKVASGLYTRDYYTNTTYYRFFIADLFPMYDKALYLDSDIIVKGDISRLYESNVNGKLVGAVYEEVMYLNPSFYRYTSEVIGSTPREYFNAGILVMNLEEFRKQGLYRQFTTLLRKRRFPVAQDQDYLNVLCYGKVKYLPLGWNKTPLKKRGFNERSLNLVHYKITWKPWHYKGIPFEGLFWEYAKKTPFYDCLLKMRDEYPECDIIKDQKGYTDLVNLAEEEVLKSIKEREYAATSEPTLQRAVGY